MKVRESGKLVRKGGSKYLLACGRKTRDDLRRGIQPAKLEFPFLMPPACHQLSYRDSSQDGFHFKSFHPVPQGIAFSLGTVFL